MRGSVRRGTATSASTASAVPLLQERLALNRYLCRELGFEDFKAMRGKLRESPDGYADDGHTFYFHGLLGQRGTVREVQLREYDLRIKGHVDRLNTGARDPKVRLKYFQWLAVLFTEMYLDRYFNHRAALLAGLNQYLSGSGWAEPGRFGEDDLTKLAYWMATGSGKTLIMHINLWQYLHYCRTQHDNILLITPTAGLSKQHVEQLGLSGIPVQHYGHTEWSLFSADRRELVTVIEVTKLKLPREKTGDGLTLDVETLGENNLLLVDEGHRGASGDKWRKVREHLARRGFTFEYSATFGQIVNGAGPQNRESLLKEYGKAIIFDYSYPHFYFDGYGKHYFIRNIDDDSDTFNDWLVLGNMLSFYEQTLLYENSREEFRGYNLEKPLWVFVGHSVTGRKNRDDEVSLTDVQEIVRFFAGFVADRARAVRRIGQLLAGQTGLKDKQGRDVFAGMFDYVRQQKTSVDELYSDILQRVFHASPGAMLRAVELKRAEGEIGLRVGPEGDYFGVVNIGIGYVAGLLKLLAEQGVACESVNIAESETLFGDIGSPESKVNLLIGSRKFMEGWDCFRVSSMGLMNIGRGEGSQIVQLFGRGVRLWGKGHSLKRSAALNLTARPKWIDLLETLNVFGIRASYMNDENKGFLKYLKDEGIQQFVEVEVPVYINQSFLARNLHVLRLPEDDSFAGREGVVLSLDQSIRVTLDLRPRLTDVRPGETEEAQVEAVRERPDTQNAIAQLREFSSLFDWGRIYFGLLEWKQKRELYNLSFTPAVLKDCLRQGNLELLCTSDALQPEGNGSLRRAENLAVQLLCKYAGAYYDRLRRGWERNRLRLAALSETDRNLDFQKYVVRARMDFAERVNELVQRADSLREVDEQRLPFVHFDQHLYVPLLTEDAGIEAMAPPGLNVGEKKFVLDLREHFKAHQGEFSGRELFLLRNLTRGRGIGFFAQASGEEFYPDFILWLVAGAEQRIAFIDPHGLHHLERPWTDAPKVRLCRELEGLSGCPDNVKLTSVIVSTSSLAQTLHEFRDATEESLMQHNILFQEDNAYVAKLVAKVAGLL